LLLVRTLRQVHRAAEAMSWLEELSRRYPERARDARLQLADIALAEHSDQRAQAFAQEAAATAPGDPRVVLRAAAVQERLGHFDEALQMYRRLVEPNRDPVAVLALTSLLSRLGRVDEQRELLRQAFREGTDDEIIVEAGRRAVALEESLGTLEALETYVADTADLNAAGAVGLARRRVLATILARVVPPAYQRQWRDSASLMKLRRFARHGLRPLLDLVSAPDAEPDVRVIEVLGMLGRPEAIPELARIVAPDLDLEERNVATRSISSSKDELAAVAVIALGRLGGEGARTAIESVAEPFRPALRLPVLWALGRVGGPVAVRLAKQEIGRAPIDGAVIGCLTLGRVGARDDQQLLEALVADPGRERSIRIAALFGLALGRHPASTAMLTRLVDSGDAELAGAARTAFGAFPTRGNDGARHPSTQQLAADEAAAISGGHIDPEALLQFLLTAVDVAGDAAQVEESRDSPRSVP
jgi:tetratricopeptide (TPR) repeat protein